MLSKKDKSQINSAVAKITASKLDKTIFKKVITVGPKNIGKIVGSYFSNSKDTLTAEIEFQTKNPDDDIPIAQTSFKLGKSEKSKESGIKKALAWLKKYEKVTVK